MAKKDPGTSAALWASRTSAATQQYINGVQSVTTSPGQLASQAAALWASNTAAAQQKFATATARVSLGEWQNAAVTKGAPRIAGGVTAATPKFTTFLTALMQYEYNGLASLPPRGDINANIARMNAWVTYMHNFQKPAGT
jgi:hypothetical protein